MPDRVGTYRVQLHAGFDFDAAGAVVDYLRRLGVSHLYCSPYMTAAAGSSHGYDVVDPTQVNPELGGNTGLRRLRRGLEKAGMGQVLDIVPNHMFNGDPRNRWWWDVLRHGRASRYADFFDIDWEAPGLEGKVLLPVLGGPAEAVLAGGKLRVLAGSEPMLAYHDARFPLAPGTESAGDASEVLAAQHYVLDYWRTGLSRVNYRRFFDVSSLVGVRVETPGAYSMVHKRVLQLVADGTVDGLRVDHVDGLADPRAYLVGLRRDAGDAWLLVEKILAAGERLAPDWPVEGTTGYDFGARALELFVDPSSLAEMDSIHRQVSGVAEDFGRAVANAKRDVVTGLLSSDVDLLLRLAERAGSPVGRDVLTAFIVALPVYRTYLVPGDAAGPADVALVHDAAASARGASGDFDGAERLEALLLGRDRPADELAAAAAAAFVRRLQQVTSAVAAKGVEDTAFYRHTRLLALNEVGGDPARFGIGVGAFHDAARRALAEHPDGLNATATHDTKRGEDVRARLAVLSQVPTEWRAALGELRRRAAPHRGEAVDGVTEHLLYQTLVGAHPLDADRAVEYMGKACREAKAATSWLDPDAGYEAAVESFVRGVIADPGFMDVLEAFVARIIPAAITTSLSLTLLKLVSPGVPDIYQGCELWDFSLVDPDNRRPVDFGARDQLLGRLESGVSGPGVMAEMATGLPKMHLVRQGLALRRRHRDAFGPGSTYAPIEAGGGSAGNVVAFTRGNPGPVCVAVMPRFATRVERRGWSATTIALPPGGWRNLLTGEAVDGGEADLEGMLAGFPVALMERA